MQAAATRAHNYVTGGALPTVEDLKDTTKYAEIKVDELSKISDPPPRGTKYYAVKNDTSEVLALTYTGVKELSLIEKDGSAHGHATIDKPINVSALPFNSKITFWTRSPSIYYFITDSKINVIANSYEHDDLSIAIKDWLASNYTFYKTVSTQHTENPLIAPTGGSKRKTRKQSRRVRNKRSKKSRGRRS